MNAVLDPNASLDLLDVQDAQQIFMGDQNYQIIQKYLLVKHLAIELAPYFSEARVDCFHDGFSCYLYFISE